MNHEESQKHFAEICDCIFKKMLHLEQMDRQKKLDMCKVLAHFSLIAWNACLQYKSYAEVQNELRKFAKEEYDNQESILIPLLDAAELKWREYRNDREVIIGADIVMESGHPHAVARFQGDRPSYEYLNLIHFRTLQELNVATKRKLMSAIIELQPFLAPLCKNAEACFEESEKFFAQEKNFKKQINYLGSIPELILTVAAAYIENTDFAPCGQEVFDSHKQEAKFLVSLLLKDEAAFQSHIADYMEHDLFQFITEKIQSFNLPEKEFKKQLAILLAWSLLIEDWMIANDMREWDNDYEEEYDFDEKNLKLFQLHVKLRRCRCSADILIPENATFQDLHECFMDVFERWDDHLFRFECEDGCIVVRAEEDLEDGDAAVYAEHCYIGHHLDVGSGAFYLFDYGDYWEHDITVKKITQVNPQADYPKIVKITGKIPPQYPEPDAE